jgi:hypothetical protein
LAPPINLFSKGGEQVVKGVDALSVGKGGAIPIANILKDREKRSQNMLRTDENTLNQ